MKLRTAAATATTLALGAGALMALPQPASAAVAPKLVSITASPKIVTTVGKLNAAKKVTVTAVFEDPDDVLDNAAFSTSGPVVNGQSSNTSDYSSVDNGSRRTFSWTFDEDYNSKPGVRRAYVAGQVKYYQNQAGTAGSTTYVVKNKPLLSLSGTRSVSYIWGTKAKLYGNLTSTPNKANKKITIQFDKKGKQKGKQWRTKQVLRTDANGTFFTKKFKINTEGKWRAVYGGSKYVLKATGTFKVKRPY